MTPWTSAASLAVMTLALFGSTAVVSAVPVLDDVCNMKPFVIGTGKAAFRRFSFDAASGVCRSFIWGGADGNENNFKTLEQCLSACNPDCIDEGACAGFPGFPIGDKKEAECMKKCNACIDDCNLEQPPNDGKAQKIKQECIDECTAPVNEADPCWFYDGDAGICKFSIDGACDTGNTFESFEDCMKDGTVSMRCFNTCGLYSKPPQVTVCLKNCNACIDYCNLEQGPNDGIAQQIKEECIQKCVPGINP